MKTPHRMVGCLVVAICAIVSRTVCADGPPPLPITSDWLGYWSFDETNLVDASGSPPLTASNLVLVAGLQSNAVEMDVTGPAVLRYSETQTNGWPNFLCDRGSVLCWVKLNDMASNTYVPLIEVGTWTEDASVGWWALYWQEDTLSFAAQTNGAQELRNRQ